MSSADRTRERQRTTGTSSISTGLTTQPGTPPDDVQVLVDLLVELDQAPLAVLAHVVANGDDRLVLAAHRVDVFHAVDLVEDLLQRRGDQLLDLGREWPGKLT